ncbi:hypothetical protein [Streptomyces sp. NPDC004230]
MATTTTPTPPKRPMSDDEARMRAFQIIGSDIDAPPAWSGDWRVALKDTADRWATDSEDPQPAS